MDSGSNFNDQKMTFYTTFSLAGFGILSANKNTTLAQISLVKYIDLREILME